LRSQRSGGALLAAQAQAAPSTPSEQQLLDSARAMALIRKYQFQGHVMARVDPLNLKEPTTVKELSIEHYGFTAADLDRPIFVGSRVVKGFLGDGKPYKTLREILSLCQRAYCGSVGYEYMHIEDTKKCNWLRERIETLEKPATTKEVSCVRVARARRISVMCTTGEIRGVGATGLRDAL
jgi:2-oxoglutarate dehydrogenase E1 component